MDDDDQIAADLEGLDITACKETIEQLLAERERRQEYTERLQEKLKALNNELAARNEELDRRQKELQQEQQRNKRKADHDRDLQQQAAAGGGALVPQTEEDLKAQREHVRDIVEGQLQDILQERKANKDIMRALVEKPPAEARREATRIDTVLITYLRANTDEKYYLSYRVGENVTAAELRKDACLYWGLSEVEYILWTHTEGSKLHDELPIQSCFKPNEEARLVLRRKTPQEVRVMERERDAIRPKTGSGRLKKKAAKKAAGGGAEGIAEEQTGDQQDSILEQMATVPGLREFMTRRDEYIVEHVDRVKLRNICAYLFLVLATCVSFWLMKPPNTEYICRYGVYTAMVSQTSESPSFEDIHSQQELWDWLMNTVPDQLMVSSSQLRATNYMPGYLHVRQQRVKAADRAQCDQNDIPSGVVCLAQKYDESTAGTEELTSISEAWSLRDALRQNASAEATATYDAAEAAHFAALASENDSNASNETTTPYPTTTSMAMSEDVRGAAVPWVFQSAASQADRVGPEGGLYQRYDASGYEIDYNLQFADLTVLRELFLEDMGILKDYGWIDNRTRALHVSFATYNGNYDMWLNNLFLVEMPPSGIMETSSDVEVFRPVIMDFSLGLDQLVTDGCRLLVALYILFFQIPWEWSYENRVCGSRFTYLLGAQGIADLGIVACFLTAFGLRFLTFGLLAEDSVVYRKTLSGAYQSVGTAADVYNNHLLLEGIILALAIFRFFSQMRVNREVFIIWRTIKDSLALYRYLMLCLLPVIPGMVVLAHALWRPFLREFRTFWSTSAATLMLLIGERDTIQTLNDLSRPWTTVFATLFYVVAVLIFVNSYVAVLVQTHQRVRITCGWVTQLYSWEEYQYVQWCLWKPFATIYTWLRGSRMRIPFDEDDEDTK